MTNLVELRAVNEKRWGAMKIAAGLVSSIDKTAKRLVATEAKQRYLAVQGRTGVPWFVVAVIHQREASGSWSANIAQGDPWNRKSTHVPVGRGPFASWEDAAVDALVNCAPYAGRNRDWSAGGALTILEEYNGLGYAARGVPSPYVWASTDQYSKGKYVADHDYDPNAVDRQIGCAALLRSMAVLDPSVKFAAATLGSPQPAQEEKNTPAPTKVAPERKPTSEAPKGSKAPPQKVSPKATGGAIVVATTAAVAHQAGLSGGEVLGIAVLVAIVIGIVIYVNRKG